MTRTLLFLPLLMACTATHDEAPEPTPEPAPQPSVEPNGDGVTPEVIPDVPRPDEAEQPPVQAEPGRFPTPSHWTSPACEGRAYERQIQFEGNRFAAKDLVSPCPPDVACVWSGIIDREGEWSLDRKQLRLTPDADAPNVPQAGKFPLPEHLWLAEDGTMTEDDGACPYSMMD